MPLEENTPYGSPKPDPNAPNYWDAEPEFAIEPSPWEDDPNPKPPQETGQSPVMPGGESGLPEGAIAPLGEPLQASLDSYNSPSPTSEDSNAGFYDDESSNWDDDDDAYADYDSISHDPPS